MKRSASLKRQPLKRRSPLRARRKAEPGRAEWKKPTFGYCHNCGKVGWLVKHHVIYEQHVRRENGDPWDQRNAMLLGQDCKCHQLQHSGLRRISVTRLPDEALAFATDLFGLARTAAYVRRHYDYGELGE